MDVMTLPILAYTYLPMLMLVQHAQWPAAPEPWIMAAQIERETCITLKHSRCWSPLAKLETPRELGLGLGQFTRAYNADGSIRFDKQAELRAQFPKQLGRWTWEQRYDPLLQMHGLVLMDRTEHARFTPLAATPRDTWAMSLAAYNGGTGSVMKDRLLCTKAPGCNPRVWAGNVETHSTKSRTKWKGYGQSAYDISRGYVRQVLLRSAAYKGEWN